jgi:hypothetical protein
MMNKKINHHAQWMPFMLKNLIRSLFHDKKSSRFIGFIFGDIIKFWMVLRFTGDFFAAARAE